MRSTRDGIQLPVETFRLEIFDQALGHRFEKLFTGYELLVKDDLLHLLYLLLHFEFVMKPVVVPIVIKQSSVKNRPRLLELCWRQSLVELLPREYFEARKLHEATGCHYRRVHGGHGRAIRLFLSLHVEYLELRLRVLSKKRAA